MRVTIRTSHRRRGQFVHRIEYLAEVRNAALRPLYELRDSEGEVFDSIIFMNDILPCVDDLLELIWQSRRQNAGITCAADYMYHDEIVSLVPSSHVEVATFSPSSSRRLALGRTRLLRQLGRSRHQRHGPRKRPLRKSLPPPRLLRPLPAPLTRPSPIVLERRSRPRPCTILRLGPCEVQDGGYDPWGVLGERV